MSSSDSKPPLYELRVAIERMERELRRQGPATARVGGMFKVGLTIDDVLRHTLKCAAALASTSPRELLRNQRCHTPVDKAPTGKLLAALESLPHHPNTAQMPPWVNDVVDASQKIRAVVEVRNRMKQGGAPPSATDQERMRVLLAIARDWEQRWA